jgi:hypothetical protein
MPPNPAFRGVRGEWGMDRRVCGERGERGEAGPYPFPAYNEEERSMLPGFRRRRAGELCGDGTGGMVPNRSSSNAILRPGAGTRAQRESLGVRIQAKFLFRPESNGCSRGKVGGATSVVNNTSKMICDPVDGQHSMLCHPAALPKA